MGSFTRIRNAEDGMEMARDVLRREYKGTQHVSKAKTYIHMNNMLEKYMLYSIF